MTTNNIYTSGEYLKNNPLWHEEDSHWKAQYIISILRRNNILPDRVCEIGCGAGEILRVMSENFTQSDFFGFDISPQAYSIAKEKESDRVHFLNEDAFGNGDHYDVVMAIDVFEHIDDYLSFLRSAKKKGEYKIYHIPLNLSAQMVLREKPLLIMRKTIGHIHYFTKGTAIATLEYTGHEIIDHEYTAGLIEHPNKNVKSKIAALLRKFMFRFSSDFAVRLLGGYSLIVLCK